MSLITNGLFCTYFIWVTLVLCHCYSVKMAIGVYDQSKFLNLSVTCSQGCYNFEFL